MPERYKVLLTDMAILFSRSLYYRCQHCNTYLGPVLVTGEEEAPTPECPHCPEHPDGVVEAVEAEDADTQPK